MSLLRKTQRRIIVSLVVVAMILTALPAMAVAASPSDISNHWAKDQISDWLQRGLISGYPDGTFKPDRNITRAEFMALVNGAFGYTGKAAIDYKDVQAGAWYADAVAKAKAAGYITGYSDGTIKPNNPITRQEVAVVIQKIKKLEQNPSAADKFSDAAGIPAWSKGAIGAAVTAGVMGGYPDGSFKAASPIKRAEAVVALSKVLTGASQPEVPANSPVVYDKAGVYGPATGTDTVKGNVIIKSKDITLQNTIIEGDLTIDKTVGDGNVTLKKVTVKGNTYVNGGGTNSVYFIDTQTGNTYVLKDNGPVRIVASGTSEIAQLVAQSSVKVEESNLTGKGFEGIVVDKKVDGKIEINMAGAKVDSLEVKSEGVTVNADKATEVKTLEVKAADVTVKTEKGTAIETLVADAKVAVTGAGTIETAKINANGVTFETKPVSQEVASGVSAPTVSTSSSSGGGGGGSSTPAKYAVTVADVVGGTASVSVDKTTAAAGDKVTVSIANIESGKQFKSITVTDANNGNVSVTAVTAGAKYTFTMPAKAVTVTVTVNPVAVAVNGVSLDKSTMSLIVGETGTLVATVSPADATNKNVTWSSSDTNVATVADGVVTAVAEGMATIAVTTVDGGKTATCEVTVNLQNSTISPTMATFDKYTSSADYKDVTVTMALNGNTLTAIKNSETALTAGTDYTVSGNTVTIKKEYLAAQANGNAALTFDFSAGADPTLAVTVSDNTLQIPETLTVTNPTKAGFTLSLSPALPGLSKDDFIVTAPDGGNIPLASAVGNGDGSSYTITAALPAGKTVTVTVAKAGYSFNQASVTIPPDIVLGRGQYNDELTVVDSFGTVHPTVGTTLPAGWKITMSPADSGGYTGTPKLTVYGAPKQDGKAVYVLTATKPGAPGFGVITVTYDNGTSADPSDDAVAAIGIYLGSDGTITIKP